MPIRYSVQPGKRRVHCTVEGSFSTAEITEAVLGILHEPEFGPGFEILSDHRRIGEPITRSQVESLVSLLASHHEKLSRVRLAVVVSKPASLGMMNMLATLSENLFRQVQVFPSMEQAEEWFRKERREEPDGRSGKGSR